MTRHTAIRQSGRVGVRREALELWLYGYCSPANLILLVIRSCLLFDQPSQRNIRHIWVVTVSDEPGVKGG